MPPRRVVVIVPGAGNHPAHYEKLVFFLQANAFDVHCVDLPSSNGARPPTSTYHHDQAAVRAVVAPLVDAGRLVLLLMHSYGGTCGNDALPGLLVPHRAARGLPGGVAHLCYLGAYVLTEGTSIWDLCEHMHLEEFVFTHSDITDDGVLVVKDPAFTLGLDLEDHEQEEQGCLWSPFPFAIFHEPVQFCPWKEIPSTYFYCSEDVAMPRIFQTYMLERIHDFDVDFNIIVFESGHSPHVKFTREICQEISRVADLWEDGNARDCEGHASDA